MVGFANLFQRDQSQPILLQPFSPLHSIIPFTSMGYVATLFLDCYS